MNNKGEAPLSRELVNEYQGKMSKMIFIFVFVTYDSKTGTNLLKEKHFFALFCFSLLSF